VTCVGLYEQEDDTENLVEEFASKENVKLAREVEAHEKELEGLRKAVAEQDDRVADMKALFKKTQAEHATTQALVDAKTREYVGDVSPCR
jgi:hypothetical protein